MKTMAEIAAQLRTIADEQWDMSNDSVLRDIAKQLEEFCVLMLAHKEEYPHIEVLTSLPVPVRRVEIDYMDASYSDSGYITVLGVGTEREEQDEIVNSYLAIINEANEMHEEDSDDE